MFVDNMARSLAAWMKTRVLAEMPSLILDGVGLAAIGSISYGAWLAYKPAGFIVAGVIVLPIVFFVSRTRST